VNNFAIVTLPQQLTGLLTDTMSQLLSLVKPYAYVMSYSGGAHKSIMELLHSSPKVWRKILEH
jgi:hypothetical protein